LRVTDDFGGMPRGTVDFQGTLVRGYPSIGRILRLETGLKEVFSGPFWVEEKINGYNIRIARIGEELLALTRGGFICPFTTDRLADLLDPGFFWHRPDLVLCGEVAGPDNPYMVGAPPYVQEDVRLFVFDVTSLGGSDFLPCSEKSRLLHEFGLPAAPSYGRYESTQWKDLRDLLRHLDGDGLEGIVLKEDPPRGRRGKCVTGASDIEDILLTGRELVDLPAQFFTRRVLRLALFMDEQGLENSFATQRELGAAFLEDLLQALEQFKKQRRVFHTFRCRFRDPTNAERLLERVRSAEPAIRVQKPRLRLENGYHVLEFEKVHTNITGLLGHLMGGGQEFD
jgi:putative ATP-dependent DNA ligase